MQKIQNIDKKIPAATRAAGYILKIKVSNSGDRIYFGSDGSLTLYFGEVRVLLGTGDNLDEKIMKLQYMLPELSGKKGTLRMENYTEDTQNIPFEPDTIP